MIAVLFLGFEFILASSFCSSIAWPSGRLTRSWASIIASFGLTSSCKSCGRSTLSLRLPPDFLRTYQCDASDSKVVFLWKSRNSLHFRNLVNYLWRCGPRPFRQSSRWPLTSDCWCRVNLQHLQSKGYHFSSEIGTRAAGEHRVWDGSP